MLYSIIHSKLDLVIDAEHRSPIHLGQIADSMCEWEGAIADELGLADSMREWEGAIADQLGLTPADVAVIKKKYPGQPNLQA